MTIKRLFKALGLAVIFDISGSIIYLLFMLLFAWMSHWWWIFIVTIGIGQIVLLISLGQVINSLIILLCKDLFGKILAIIISLHLTSFALHAVWNAEFLANPTKTICVKIIASIVFVSIYIIPTLYTTFFLNQKE